MTHRILIVGGGFGGVAASLALHKKCLRDTEITLINPKPWLEYYGVLYRLIAGKNASEACIPLQLILGKTKTKIILDTVKKIDAKKKAVTGVKGSYSYDTLILAPGSVPAYFNIPGMEEHSITMRTAIDAITLRTTMHQHLDMMVRTKNITQKRALGRFVIVGAGPTGIEIAGEFLPLTRKLAKIKGIDPALLSVDLIEAADRLLPTLEQGTSAKVHTQLEKMGVRVRLRTTVASAEKGAVILHDGKRIESGTIIWTAGVKANPLVSSIVGVETDKRGRVIVDEQLRAKGQKNIFILGDCASTPYAGMAQTAVGDGIFAAQVIAALARKKTPPAYAPAAPAYAIPVGPYWAAVKFGFLRVYGFMGYILRRAADIHVYMLIIPWRYIPATYMGKTNLRKHGITL